MNVKLYKMNGEIKSELGSKPYRALYTLMFDFLSYRFKLFRIFNRPVYPFKTIFHQFQCHKNIIRYIKRCFNTPLTCRPETKSWIVIIVTQNDHRSIAQFPGLLQSIVDE